MPSTPANILGGYHITGQPVFFFLLLAGFQSIQQEGLTGISRRVGPESVTSIPALVFWELCLFRFLIVTFDSLDLLQYEEDGVLLTVFVFLVTFFHSSRLLTLKPKSFINRPSGLSIQTVFHK